MKHLLSLATMVLLFTLANGQVGFTFAHVSDTHIGSAHADEDLRKTVSDINQDTAVRFVLLSGDITDFGSDEELLLAKQILDSLNKPWYIVPGNHDANWSESGTNSFKKIFGSETFKFTYGGYLFLGTVCGPNMRMGPGQVSRENIVWLDSTLQHLPNPNIPIIYVNHYPQDTSLNNWYEIIDELKKFNTQLIICGHGHSNHLLNFEGIPAVMGRSNLRARKPVGGFNIVTIANGKATYEERNPVTSEQTQWAKVDLFKHNYATDTTPYFRPSYLVNRQYAQVQQKWEFHDNSDIGSGIASFKSYIVVSNSLGEVYALKMKNGKRAWTFKTQGKIYSTPAVSGNLVVVASTDNNIYCLNAARGKMVWQFETAKPIVANPLVHGQTVYIGASDGHFRAIDLQSGLLRWDFEGVRGFVVTTPLFYEDKLYFGSWGTEFYALDAGNGKLVWKWNNGSENRMFSPAACVPVAVNNRIFIVAPDRYMTVFDASAGNLIWRKKDEKNRVRESMGMSADSSLVFAKTMDGNVIGISTAAPDMDIAWRSDAQLHYEIAPTAIVEYNNIVFVPSNSGVVTAIDRSSGRVLWQHKISNCMITSMLPVGRHTLVASTMDGIVARLNY